MLPNIGGMGMGEAEKRRPLVERIAGLDTKSSFRDIRDGIGGSSSYDSISDQDIAAALGVVKSKIGSIPVQALETYYASTLMHEHRLRAAWAEYSERPDDDNANRIRNRIAAALAIREFAGFASPSSLLAEWGVITDEPEISVRRRVAAVLSWLEGLRADAYGRFKKAVGYATS